MKRLIFINRFFFPDHSATSQILSELTFHLAGLGHDVHVITSRQSYDDPKADLPHRETIRGVNVHRVFSTRFGRSTLLSRTADYISFCVACRRALLSLAGPGSLTIAKTDPPMIGIVAMWVSKRKHSHLVNWLQDMFPEVAIRLGVPLLQGRIGRCLTRLRNQSLRFAVANIAIGNSMAHQVLAQHVLPEQIHVIHNWCDDDQIVPVPPADNQLRLAWSLEDKFVVGYSGNLGRAHDIDTVLKAAEILKANPRFVFVVIGGGLGMDGLMRQVTEHGLQRSFRFMPYQNQATLKDSLSVPDVHWISLKPELEGLLFPSKLYGIAAAGRPIVAIGSTSGELAQLVQKHQCGLAIEQGDAEGLALALTALSTDSQRCATMGRRARIMLDDIYTRRKAFDLWQTLLKSLAGI